MQIANFTVCCDSGYGDKKKTEFVRCTAFDKLAGVCTQYLQKGSLVYISGPMDTRKWQDKDGNNRYSTGIIVHEMKMLSGKGDGQAAKKSDDPTYGQHGFDASTGEEVPF